MEGQWFMDLNSPHKGARQQNLRGNAMCSMPASVPPTPSVSLSYLSNNNTAYLE